MNTSQSVIGKAKELLQTHGKEYALKFFNDKIQQITPAQNFEDTCIIAGYETAIEWLELGDEGMNQKVREFLKTLKK